MYCFLPIQVVEYRYLKVNFESKVTWKMETDYLRCSPSFFGRERNDGVVYLLRDENRQTGSKAQYGFGNLLFIFTLKVKGEGDVPFALIENMSPVATRRRMDKELGLCRVRSDGRRRPSVILAQSILRGALLYRVPDHASDYYVIDSIDADMFLRMQQIFHS